MTADGVNLVGVRVQWRIHELPLKVSGAVSDGGDLGEARSAGDATVAQGGVVQPCELGPLQAVGILGRLDRGHRLRIDAIGPVNAPIGDDDI